jgi:chemotaxis family two-component system response regulator PixH
MNTRPKVLTIHNNASTCLFIASALQQAGYEVEIALTGQEGFAKIINWRPQCLIVDVLLPDMSGYAICRRVRQSLPEEMMRIFLMSSQEATLDQSYGLRQGADHYLSQPLTAETLLLEIWERLPDDLRSVVSGPSSVPSQPVHAFQELLAFTPQRLPDHGLMRVSNPFADPGSLKHKQVRRLYLAINGKKTVSELAAASRIEPEETARYLAILLKEGRIQVRDTVGEAVNEVLFFSALEHE